MSIATAITTESRDAWLAERKKAIGASEVAAVLGVDPHKSAAALFWEKSGLVEPDNLDGIEFIEWGTELQPVVGAVFGRRTGRLVKAEPDHTVRRSIVHPWLAASLDFEQEADGRPGPGALEIKTSGEFMRKMWADGPPLHYQVQLQAQLCVCGLQWGTIAVLMGGNRLMHWDFDRNESFIEAMVIRTREFWSCVQAGMPPEIDGSMHTASALAKLFPDDNGTALMMPDEAADKFRRLEKLRALQSVMEKKRRSIENELRSAIGEATYAVLPDGTIWDTKRIDVAERTQTVEAYSYRRMIRRAKPLPNTVRFIGDADEVPRLDAPATDDGVTTYRTTKRLKSYRKQKRRMLADNPHCIHCGATLTTMTATLEHVIPLAAGGDNRDENLALACWQCNQEYGDQLDAPSKN